MAKCMPSIDAEARKLWSKFSALRQGGRPMVEHVNDYITVKSQLVALGETVTRNTQFDNDALIIPGLPSQDKGIWGDWHHGRDGYPAIYVALGHNKPVMRTLPVDGGATWTSAACAADQVRKPCERHNVDVAALKENSRGMTSHQNPWHI